MTLEYDLQLIAEGCGKHIKTSNGYDICCPVHGEENPSASITIKNGKLLTHCHSCHAEHVVFKDKLIEMGLIKAKEKSHRSTRSQKKKTVYKINDANGKYLVSHVRVDTDEGKLVWWEPKLSEKGLKVKDLPLYGIDKIKDAQTVVITEGEKAADKLMSIGVAAVGTVTGASSIPSVTVLRELKYKNIELWPDNDDPGRKHMSRIADVLKTQKIHCKIIKWNEAPEKGDAADFVEAGNGKEAFERLPRESDFGGSSRNNWEHRLKKTKDGYSACDANILLTLKLHEDLRGCFGYDKRSHAPVILKVIPGVTNSRKTFPRPIETDETGRLVTWFLEEMGITISHTKLEYLLLPACTDDKHCRKFDPFMDYLESIKWDGTYRLDSMLIHLLDAEDNEYVRTVTSNIVIAAVARTYEPGCKVDNMLVMVSDQGIKKSTLFNALVPEDRYFADYLPNINHPDARAQLHGLVFLEIAELEALNNADTAAIKSFLTSRIDRFRPPYGRAPQDFARTCVFIGSTNKDEFLKDVTGARRFWPVRVKKKADIKWIVENRDQIWAEAVERYKSGEQWWLDDTIGDMQEEIAEQFREEAVWESVIDDYLHKPFSSSDLDLSLQDRFEGGVRRWTTSDEIFMYALKMDVSKWGKREQICVSKALRALNWRRNPNKKTIDGQRKYWYEAPRYFINEMLERQHLVHNISETENVVPMQREFAYRQIDTSGPIDY